MRDSPSQGRALRAWCQLTGGHAGEYVALAESIAKVEDSIVDGQCGPGARFTADEERFFVRLVSGTLLTRESFTTSFVRNDQARHALAERDRRFSACRFSLRRRAAHQDNDGDGRAEGSAEDDDSTDAEDTAATSSSDLSSTEVESGDDDSDQPGSIEPASRSGFETAEQSREQGETDQDRLRRWSSCIRCGVGTPDSQSHFLDCPAGETSRTKAWTAASREAVRAARLSTSEPRRNRLAIALTALVARGASTATNDDADPGERREWHYTERAGLVPARDVASELDRICQRGQDSNNNKEWAVEKKRLIKMTRHAFVRASAHIYGDHMKDAAGRCEYLAGRPQS